MSAILDWRGEVPYHVARLPGRQHYSIELVAGPVSYFELKGTHIWPARKFLTLGEAKEAAQRDYDQRKGRP